MSIYTENGFVNRIDYLKNLSAEYGIPLKTVKLLANLLGEDEDFDGLLTSLQDYERERRFHVPNFLK